MTIQLQKNSLLSFFFRLFFVIGLSTLLGMLLVYTYFQNQNAEIIEKQVILASNKYDKELDIFLSMSKEKQAIFLSKTDAYFNHEPLTRIQLSDAEHNILLDYQKQKYPMRINDFFDKLFIPDNTHLNYMMLPINNKKLVLLYIHKIEKPMRPPLFLKIILPLDSDQTLQLREGMQKAFGILLITMLLIMATIFPIVYTQYKKLNEDRYMLLKNNLETVIALGNAIALRDSDTHNHNYRVTYYAIRLAEKLKISTPLFPSLIKGAFLHDVGKIGIPDAILLKPNALSTEEFTIMKTHVTLGLSLIQHLEWLKDASFVIAAHHERYDGKGYPLGLSDNKIPMIARIFSVVDIFDALTSKRPYKEAWSFDESAALLRSESGKHFDPTVISAFLEIGYELWLEVNAMDIDTLEKLLAHAIEPYTASFESNIKDNTINFETNQQQSVL